MKRPSGDQTGWEIFLGSGETQRASCANQFHVDIKVILLLSIPGEGHLVAVREKEGCRSSSRDNW